MYIPTMQVKIVNFMWIIFYAQHQVENMRKILL